jgi:hypothetical protein
MAMRPVRSRRWDVGATGRRFASGGRPSVMPPTSVGGLGSPPYHPKPSVSSVQSVAPADAFPSPRRGGARGGVGTLAALTLNLAFARLATNGPRRRAVRSEHWYPHLDRGRPRSSLAKSAEGRSPASRFWTPPFASSLKRASPAPASAISPEARASPMRQSTITSPRSESCSKRSSRSAASRTPSSSWSRRASANLRWRR